MTVEYECDDFNELIMSDLADAAQIDLFFAQVPLLSKLDPNKRLQLAKVAVEKPFRDGDFIVQAGEKGDTMYIVLDGVAVVTSVAGQELARKRRGDYFGEIALLNDAPRAANVLAKSAAGSTSVYGTNVTSCLEISRMVPTLKDVHGGPLCDHGRRRFPELRVLRRAGPAQDDPLT